jgi:hypothetical protein
MAEIEPGIVCSTPAKSIRGRNFSVSRLLNVQPSKDMHSECTTEAPIAARPSRIGSGLGRRTGRLDADISGQFDDGVGPALADRSQINP